LASDSWRFYPTLAGQALDGLFDRLDWFAGRGRNPADPWLCWEPAPLSVYYAARDRYFPKAKRIVIERIEGDGSQRVVTIPLRPRKG
jgi:hypothetical protein